MSIELMSMAFKLPIPQMEKLVLLALCDHAHDDGSKCFPYIFTIAIKASASERSVQRVLAKFREIGLICVVKNGAGGKRRDNGIATHYQINVAMLAKGDMLSPLVTKNERNPTVEKVKGDMVSPLQNDAHFSELGCQIEHVRVTAEVCKGDTSVVQNHHITIKETLSGSLEFVERGDNFFENQIAGREPRPPTFENNILGGGDVFISSPPDVGNATTADAGSLTNQSTIMVEPSPECVKNKAAFEIIEYFHQKNYDILDCPTPNDYPLAEELAMVIAWLERGYSQLFCENVIMAKLHERKRAGASAVTGRWWVYFETFIAEKWREVASKNAAKAGVGSKPEAVTAQPTPLDVMSANIRLTNSRLQQMIVMKHMRPDERVAYCRDQMLYLLASEWWRYAMQAMEGKFGAAVRAAWFDQIAPVMLLEDSNILVIYAKNAMISDRISSAQYFEHLSQALQHHGCGSPSNKLRIEFTH